MPAFGEEAAFGAYAYGETPATGQFAVLVQTAVSAGHLIGRAVSFTVAQGIDLTVATGKAITTSLASAVDVAMTLATPRTVIQALSSAVGVGSSVIVRAGKNIVSSVTTETGAFSFTVGKIVAATVTAETARASTAITFAVTSAVQLAQTIGRGNVQQIVSYVSVASSTLTDIARKIARSVFSRTLSGFGRTFASAGSALTKTETGRGRTTIIRDNEE
jgi:hypothetical protein